MMQIDSDKKKLFWSGGNFKDYKLYFPEIDLTITNDIIHEESVAIKESICEEEELALGGCISSSFSFSVSEIMEYDLTGMSFTATLCVNLQEDGTSDLEFPIGIYKVESCKMVDNKDYKRVVAYDSLKSAISDISDWYNSFFAESHTIKEARESLLTYLGIPFVERNLVNDDLLIEKTVEPNGKLQGIDMLRRICELNAGFGMINREGFFEVTYLGNEVAQEIALTEDNSLPEYIESTSQEYLSEKVTGVTIKGNDDDIGTTFGNVENPYVITSNYLVFGKSSYDLRVVAENIYNNIKDIEYRPAEASINGLPYMTCGDYIHISDLARDTYTYVLSRKIEGVQNLIDSITANGVQKRSNEASLNSEILQLKGKTMSIRKEIEGLSVEVKDVEQKAESYFEQTATSIGTKVEKGEIISEINQSAEEVKIKAEKVQLEGLVTIEDLATSGATVINGDNITTGTVTAKKLYSQGESYNVIAEEGRLCITDEASMPDDDKGIMGFSIYSAYSGYKFYTTPNLIFLNSVDESTGDLGRIILNGNTFVENGALSVGTFENLIDQNGTSILDFIKASGTEILQGVLIPGNTYITFTSDYITSASVIDVYTDVLGTEITHINANDGVLVIRFKEYSNNVGVKVYIK